MNRSLLRRQGGPAYDCVRLGRVIDLVNQQLLIAGSGPHPAVPTRQAGTARLAKAEVREIEIAFKYESLTID